MRLSAPIVITTNVVGRVVVASIASRCPPQPKSFRQTVTCEYGVERVAGHCNACSKRLHGKQTRWCSPRCRVRWENQHWWTAARRTARRRAKIKHAHLYTCERCNTPTDKPEVNHIVPCGKLRLTTGCHHHQSNLETLCHTCHVATTNQQRADGLFKTRKALDRMVEIADESGMYDLPPTQ